MEVTWAAVTVMVTESVTEPLVAVITVVPLDCAVTRPEALTLATVVSFEDHETELVMLEVDPSVRVAVAVSCSVSPAAMLRVEDVIRMELRVG